MATNYPGGIDGDPATHADAWDAVHAVETTLGTDPQGDAASVAARLSATETTLAETVAALDLKVTGVVVTTGTETRPDADIVLWVGGTSQPDNMGANDVWLTPGAPTPPPVAPTGLAASAITDTGFTLTWGAVSGADDYEVRIGGVSDGTTAGLTHDFTGLTASTEYVVNVRAHGTGGWGPWSADLPVTTAAPPGSTISIYGSGAPTGVGTPTMFTDGGGALVAANAFYAKGSAMNVLGARIWVPAGSIPAGTLNMRAWLTARGNYPDTDLGWNSPSQAKDLTGLLAGQWNEILFDTPIAVNAIDAASIPQDIWIGYRWGGTNYVHAGGADGAEIQAAGEPVFLGSNPIYLDTGVRGANSLVGGAGSTYYGVDLIAELA